MTQNPPGRPAPVYGPATPQIRRFLVQLAGLGAEARSGVVDRFHSVMHTPDFASAESAMGLAIERGGRVDARDAVAGPLLQLVRDANRTDEDDPLASLEPIAEPALAAVLALLVSDLLPPLYVRVLYEPFAAEITLESLASDSPRRV